MKTTLIFKGATRPACFLGIPLVPFVLVGGGIIIVSFVLYVPLLITLVPVLLIMRQVTRDDDQRFRQLGLFFKVNRLGLGNPGRFGAVGSFSPASYPRFKRRGLWQI